MNYLVFDIETNGLLDNVTQFHCGVTIGPSGETREYRPGDTEAFLKDLSSADMLVGHNIIGYDIPALKKLFGVTFECMIWDTLVAGRTYFPDRPQGHSLKSYGPKGDFGETSDWKDFSEDMLLYCKQDTLVTHGLFQRQLKQFMLHDSELEFLRYNLWQK